MVGRAAGMRLLWALPARGKAEMLAGGLGRAEHVFSRHFFEDADAVVRLYVVMLEGATRELAEVAEVLANAEAYPVLVHCVAGKDRTGLVVAMFVALCVERSGNPARRDAVCDDYAASFANLQRARAELWKSGLLTSDIPFDDATISSPWEAMAATLRHVETRHGSVRGFFRVHVGVSEDVLDSVVRNLTRNS